MKRIRRRLSRNKKGVVAAVLCVIILLVAFMFACFEVDVAHNTQVRDQLQAGTDAGALAGVRELAKNSPTPTDQTNASTYATGITAANSADGTSIVNGGSTTVSVIVDAASNPRTVTITATRQNNNIFAWMVGGALSNVSSRTVAAATKGLTTIDPNTLKPPLAIDIDHVPSGGPAAGQKINTKLTSGSQFTIAFNSNNDSNAAWIKTWGNNATTNTSSVVIGNNYEVTNGVVNSILDGINVGDVLTPILISGGPPYNQTRQAIGIIQFVVDAKGKTNGKHWIKGHVKEPIILPGTPGTPNLPGLSSGNQQFVNQWAPWSISLIQ